MQQFARDRRTSERTSAGPGDYDQRDAFGKQRPEFEPITFAHPPPRPIAHDGRSDAPRDGHPEPRTIEFGEPACVHHEVRGLIARADLLQAQVFGATMQAIGGTERPLAARGLRGVTL